MARMPLNTVLLFGLTAITVAAIGCGSTKSRMATDQLLVSDAVDHAVTGIDFRALAGENVYFDTRYLVNVKGIGFVNSEYIISSLRQQMVAANVRMKDKPEDADLIVEARAGALGSDGTEVVYGIPASKGLSEVSSMVPGVPPVPSIPEISMARKENQVGAAKIAAFAYRRESGEPVWQSGISRQRTTSQDVWFLGIGPFQRGSIHPGTSVAGGEFIFKNSRMKHATSVVHAQPVPLDSSFVFSDQDAGKTPSEIPAPLPGSDATRVANQPRVSEARGPVPVPPASPLNGPYWPPMEAGGAPIGPPPGAPPYPSTSEISPSSNNPSLR